MPNPHPVCGNCGEPVAASDITCPHCDALLAAYASPEGSTTAHVYHPDAPVADALTSADMSVPPPAPPIEIHDDVVAVSSAPRPLFHTQLTVEDIARAAESEHDEPLVVVNEADAATKPMSFAVPDYARPPADAAPVPLLEDGDTGNIARPAKTLSRPTTSRPAGKSNATPKVLRNNTASPPPDAPGESWLYDLSRNAPTPGPTRPVRERKNRPEPARTTTLPPSAKRGRTENYLRKRHEQPGYDDDASHLSTSVDTRESWALTQAQGTNRSGQNATAEKLRQGFLMVLIGLLFFMWIGVLGGIVGGDVNTGLLVLTIALTMLARFVSRSRPTPRRR